MKETSDTGGVAEPGAPVPFQRYVEARRTGMPAAGQPMPANATKYSSPVTRVITSVTLLALVMTGIFVLSRNAEEEALRRQAGGIQTLTVVTEGEGAGGARSGPGAGAAVGAAPVAAGGPAGVAAGATGAATGAAGATGAVGVAGTAAGVAGTTGTAAGTAVGAAGTTGTATGTAVGAAGTAVGAATVPAARHYPIAAGQFVDASEERPPGPKIKGVLQPGDMVTIMPRVTRGWGYLYFIVFEPNQQLRLSRLYDAEILKHTVPPLKFTVRQNTDGPFQVLLVASEEELKSIQLMIQQANLLKIAPDKAREARFAHLLKALGSSLKEEAWSYKMLPELKYSQKV